MYEADVDDDRETTAEIWAQVDEALDEYVADEEMDAADVADDAADVVVSRLFEKSGG